MLAALAAGLGDFGTLLQAAAPEGLHGAAFRCEAWEVDGGKPGTSQRSEAMADAAGHKLHKRADRREIRSVYAVDRAGITYAAVQRRGEEDVRRNIAYPKPGEGFTGVIPQSLDRLVTALLGTEMPARRSFL